MRGEMGVVTRAVRSATIWATGKVAVLRPQKDIFLGLMEESRIWRSPSCA
jgi:CRP-like cAMP-binding protein